MKYTEIKDSGIRIPRVIFGTSALGNLYKELPRHIKTEIVSECLGSLNGTVAFDSAGKYGAGMALEELGRALSELHADPGRIVISNKLGWLRTGLTGKEPEFEKGIWINPGYDAKQEISGEGIVRCWKQGNSLLGPEYKPRMLSVHDPDEYLSGASGDPDLDLKLYKDILDAYKSLFEIRRSDNSVAIGVGAKNWKVIRRITNDNDLDWVMFANSMTIYRHPSELVVYMDELAARGITVINSAVFNAGFLTGGEFFDYRSIDRDIPVHEKLFSWRTSFFRICEEFSVSPSHACIRFGLSHPAIAAVALNTSNPAHVKTNVEEVINDIPAEFFTEMKKKGLIDNQYPYV
jgi:D-threo-aldose 1-dehydrogenase